MSTTNTNTIDGKSVRIHRVERPISGPYTDHDTDVFRLPRRREGGRGADGTDYVETRNVIDRVTTHVSSVRYFWSTNNSSHKFESGHGFTDLS